MFREADGGPSNIFDEIKSSDEAPFARANTCNILVSCLVRRSSMGWSDYNKWYGGGYGKQWYGNDRRTRSWPSNKHQKVLWCKCGNWLYAHKDHSHCTSCGTKWNRDESDQASGDKQTGNGAEGSAVPAAMSIDTLVAALEKLVGKDLRTALAEHLPQPQAVEKKLASESETFEAFRAARVAHNKAQKAKTKAEGQREAAKNKLEEATARFEQVQAEEDAAAEKLANIKKEYIETYPVEAKQKEDLLHDLEEAAEEEGPEKKKPRAEPPPAHAAFAEWQNSDSRGDDGMGIERACDSTYCCG